MHGFKFSIQGIHCTEIHLTYILEEKIQFAVKEDW